MNNKDIKKVIKEKADKVTIKDFSTEIIEKTNHVVKTEVNLEQKQKTYKKRWLLPTIFASIATCCLAVAIPLGLFAPNNQTPPPIGSDAKVNTLFSQEVMALGNVIGDLDLPSQNGGQTFSLKTVAPTTFSAVSYAQTEVNATEVAEEINGYLLTGVSLAGKQVFSTENEDADYGEYKNKVTVSYNDLKTSYVYYYNQTDIDKNSSKIEGVMIVDGNTYSVNGGLEKDEEEVEMHLSVKTGENSYIKFTNEQENEEDEVETEYSYKFVENGVTVKSVSIEFEKEDDETEMEIRINENGKVTTCEFEFFDNHIDCQYNGKKIKIEITEDTYKYIINGETVELPKNPD
ncbi:MAG: hypothetical protein IKC71_04750 [Clostridia bacterium]|nr:hypothetical protein [Clostridia bacterium]